jgi:protein involved in polysaccharide export with SLBB domain
MLELGKLKSINVFLTGQVESPGVHLIHPFSDVFTSIIQAGGVEKTGSLRKIKIIRADKVISSVDFYSFFTEGSNNFSDIRILDGDIIHIPTVSNRVEVSGEVFTPGFYEMLETSSISDLINYSGGLKPFASNKIIVREIIQPNNRTSEDISKTGRLVDFSLSSEEYLSNGSKINILPVGQNQTEVSIFGRVTNPGSYPLYKSSKETITLKDLLDLAGGFDDPIFRKTIDENIVVLRLDENQFYAKDFSIQYNKTDNFKLKVNDKIFVYEKPQYKNSFTFTINGEINSPGTYPYKEGLSISDAIDLAGGITKIGSVNSVSVTKTLKRFNEEGDEIIENERVGNISLNFLINDGNVITVLPKTNVVSVDGNIYNPGLIAHSGKPAMTMSKAIELAGGYKPYSLKDRAYVIRANGEIEKANLFRGRTKRVYPGDSVFVPVDPDPDDFDITQFISDISSTLANIAAILVIIDNN